MAGSVYDPTALGLQIAKKVGKEEVQVFCPYHHDSHPSASYNLLKGLFHCFGCGTSKTARELAEDLGGKLIAVHSLPEVLATRKGEESEWRLILNNDLAVASDYLAERNVTDIQVMAHGLLESEAGIIFPIKDKHGNTVGAQIRHFKRQPKYLFYGEREPVWPWTHLTGGKPGSRVYITEGVFGVLNFERYGWKSNDFTAVSMMGAATVPNVVKVFKQMGMYKPVAVMDIDDAGLLAAAKFILMGIPAVSYPFSLDPDEWDDRHWSVVNEMEYSLISRDIYDFINKSSDPPKMEWALKKFYRRLK